MQVNIKVYPFLYISKIGIGYFNKKGINLLNIDINSEYLHFSYNESKKIVFIFKSYLPGIELRYNANLFKFCSKSELLKIFDLYKIEKDNYRLIISDEPVVAGEIKYYPLIYIPV